MRFDQYFIDDLMSVLTNFMRFLTTSFLLILIFQFSFAQELKEGEFWDSFGEGRQEIWEYKNFSKEDVIKSRQKLALIIKSLSESEWTGQYLSNTEIGESVLFWNKQDGFTKYYFYHTLKKLNYGNTKDKNDSVIFDYESSLNLPKTKRTTVFVKVKLGERHYLIPEKKIKDFLQMAIGVYPGFADNYFYWLKTSDLNKDIFGFPQVSTKYQYLIPSPIQTKIIKIGKKVIDSQTEGYEEIYQFLILGDGKNKKIKVGMNLFVKDLDEWVEIVKVSTNNSIGKIKRSFYNKIEECWTVEGGQGDRFPCKEIKKDMRVTTRRSEYFF